MTSQSSLTRTTHGKQCIARQLESSVAACWRAQIAGSEEHLRHWRTRVGYYRAVVEALRGERADHVEVNVGDVVGHHPHGRLSTAYAIAARRSLLGAYRAHPQYALRQIDDLVRGEPMSQLVAEAKVWSFWPLRQAWVHELDERNPAGKVGPAGQGLARALASWRTAEPALAGAEGGLPPICAMEDLMILSRHALSTVRATRLLLDAEPTGVLTVPDNISPPRCSAVDRVLDDAAARIDSAIEIILGQPGGDGPNPVMALLRETMQGLTTLQRDRGKV